MREGAGAVADLVAVTAERVGFWSALADDVGRPVEALLCPGPLPVRVSSDDLSAALDALLDNVFSHTPDGVALRVVVAAWPDGGGQVSVEDAGGGIPAGVAGRGVSQGSSTGLGLDIA